MKKIFTLVLLSLFAILDFEAQNVQLSPEKVLEKAASVITNSKGISAQFKISGNSARGIGSIKGQGEKFVVTLPDVQVWYNGKEMYTYNGNTEETTIINPDIEELQESNPLLYVNAYKGKFKASYSSASAKGKYIIVLQPLTKTSNIKKLIFTINANNYKLEKIISEMNGGNTLTVEVTSLNTNLTIPSSEFEYPRKAFPKAEIIDLR